MSKKNDRTVFTGFRQSHRDKAKLRKQANKRGWSVSQLAERIVADWLKVN